MFFPPRNIKALNSTHLNELLSACTLIHLYLVYSTNEMRKSRYFWFLHDVRDSVHNEQTKATQFSCICLVWHNIHLKMKYCIPWCLSLPDNTSHDRQTKRHSRKKASDKQVSNNKLFVKTVLNEVASTRRAFMSCVCRESRKIQDAL